MDKYLQGFAIYQSKLVTGVNGLLIGCLTYLLTSKDDKILQFYMISISFSHVFIVNN